MGNSANFRDPSHSEYGAYTTGRPLHPLTDAGAYTRSESPYGTFDQGGNAWEWLISDNGQVGLRGASFHDHYENLRAENRTFPHGSTAESPGIGFRVGRASAFPVLVGDYNENDTVDAADFVLWRDTLGSTMDLAADGDLSGTVDMGDFVLWRTHFGEIIPAELTTISSVPEPSTVGVLIVGISLTTVFARRRILLWGKSK